MDLLALAPGTRVGPATATPGDWLAVDTTRRLAEVTAARLVAVGVPAGREDLNLHASRSLGPTDVRLGGAAVADAPPYRLGHRLAWLASCSLPEADEELASWRALVAGWAEEPSKPACAQVQQDLVAALAVLDTRTAVAALRGSLDLGLPDGCLFETWAWADRLLGLDLAADVGR